MAALLTAFWKDACLVLEQPCCSMRSIGEARAFCVCAFLPSTVTDAAGAHLSR